MKLRIGWILGGLIAFLVFVIAYMPAIHVVGRLDLPKGVSMASKATVPTITNLPIQLEAKVNEYLSLVMKLIFAFGISFQLPVVLSLLARIGVVDAEFLKKRRKYVIVIIFAAAAFLTPPDPITQIGLAVPLLILYELSIFAVKFIENKNLEKSDA